MTNELKKKKYKNEESKTKTITEAHKLIIPEKCKITGMWGCVCYGFCNISFKTCTCMILEKKIMNFTYKITFVVSYLRYWMRENYLAWAGQ